MPLIDVTEMAQRISYAGVSDGEQLLVSRSDEVGQVYAHRSNPDADHADVRTPMAKGATKLVNIAIIMEAIVVIIHNVRVVGSPEIGDACVADILETSSASIRENMEGVVDISCI